MHPLTKANYLASPPLVVAYALAGTVDIDLQNDPLGEDKDGNPIYLKDIWFTGEELVDAVKVSANSDYYREVYADVFNANDEWNALDAVSYTHLRAHET